MKITETLECAHGFSGRCESCILVLEGETTSVTLDKCLHFSGPQSQNLFVRGSYRMAWKQGSSFTITITDLDEVASPSERRQVCGLCVM